MLNVTKMDVMQVLDEMVSPVKRSMSFRFVSALLILVACQMNLVWTLVAAEGTEVEWLSFVATTYPSGAQRVDRVFVPSPLVFTLERPWTERAEKWKILSW
jgi:hypothetical protein